MKKSTKGLLDTNVVIAMFAGDPSVIAPLDRKEALFLPVIVVGELLVGAHRASRPEAELLRLHTFVRTVAVLNIDLETASRYGTIVAQLMKDGTSIPKNDAWIAAIAMRHQVPVITQDRHFRAVKGLHVEFLS